MGESGKWEVRDGKLPKKRGRPLKQQPANAAGGGGQQEALVKSYKEALASRGLDADRIECRPLLYPRAFEKRMEALEKQWNPPPHKR